MITYKKAGVDINKANELVRNLKRFLPSIGGFSGSFPIPRGYKNPLLLATTDGVGTKLKIAQLCNKHDTVGIDLVAMCVNDLITSGAKPLFFLDYYSCGKLDIDIATNVIKGVAKGCKIAGCRLIGGETAEMPGFYSYGEYDLAGFAVGIVERENLINGKHIKPKNVLIGLDSSGLHSNGFSLVRKVLSETQIKKMRDVLLTPTKIYVNDILTLLQKVKIKGIAHITGGGFFDNLIRIIPDGLCVKINKKAWNVPDIFRFIQKKSKVSEMEMYKVFNMGIGMVFVIDKHQVQKGWRVIGEILKGKREVTIV